jgi:hypothetical protein
VNAAPWTAGPWKLEPEAAVGRWWRVLVGENRSFITNREADARLIALAPELAEFVRGWADGEHHEFCGANPMMDDGPCYCAKGRAQGLLARARGGS